MSRTSFSALLEKYLAGQATSAERETVAQWYALLGEEPKDLSPEQWESLKARLWLKINQQEVTPVISFWRKKQTWWTAAAAALVISTVSMWYVKQENTSLPEQIALEKSRGMELVVNTSKQTMLLELEEGSRVTLRPGAELRYPSVFAEQVREVSLKGEAFFEISENPNRPFLVNAGRIVTRVLGTSFLVKAPSDNPEVEVAVKTGKVSVYERAQDNKTGPQKSNNGVILTANHKVRYLKENQLFVTALVDDPEPVTDQTAAPDFNFDDSPLDKVIMTLEQAYFIDIEVEKKSLRDCPLTANLSGKTLYAQLDLICAVIQGSYEVKGTTILISGKGCD